MLNKMEDAINIILKLIILITIFGLIISMCKMIYTTFLPLFGSSSLDILHLISQIATFFILLEFVLMLIQYLKDLHNVPVEYLIVIAITAIAREILLEHSNDFKLFFLSLSILVLVVVSLIIRKNNLFKAPH